MIARVLGAVFVLGCVLSGTVRGQAAQGRGTTWDEHRANLERAIQETESGQMLWVPNGPTLLPVRRQDFASSLVLMQIAPLRQEIYTRHPDDILDPALTSEVSRIARDAVAATEAFRRTLRAELDRVNAFLNSNSGMGSVVVDITNSERVQYHLRSAWRLTVTISDQSSEFRNQAEVLRQATRSTLAITSVACSPTAPPKVDCILSGRLTWNGDPAQPIAAFRTGSLAEDLRRASFISPSAANSGLVRFSVSADLAGGNLDFWASLNPATGNMEAGTISWAASGRSTNVGTWSAVRQVQ
jgi:hypothetical protein